MGCLQGTPIPSKALNCGPSSRRSPLCHSLSSSMLIAKPSWMEFAVASNGFFRPKGGTTSTGSPYIMLWTRVSWLRKWCGFLPTFLRRRIGEVLCGNGKPITRDMWLGNKLVDELAKLGPRLSRPRRTWCGRWLPGSSRLRNSLSLLGR